ATLKCPNNKCNNISSPLYLVEKVLVNELKSWLQNYKVVNNYELSDLPYKNSIKEKNAMIKQIHKKLLNLEKQKNQIYIFLEQGVYDTDLYNERIRFTINQIQNTKNILYKLSQELDILNKQIKNRDLFVSTDEDIFALYYKLEAAADRNDILKEIIEKFEYIKEKPNSKGNRDNPSFKLKIFPKLIKP
ncbi:MAG TPA: hypothetical protein GXZ90_08745, partial [Clostridiales bacterium]|nr:hypothetical protein [Clostridiales bacterium]